MGINVDLRRYDYEKTKKALLDLTKEKDETKIDKILSEFGTRIDNDYIVLCNEYYEDGHCLWNCMSFIEQYYKLKEDTYNCFIYSENGQMVDYKPIDVACENLGIDIEELDQE